MRGYWVTFTFTRARTERAANGHGARLDAFCRGLSGILPKGWVWADWTVNRTLSDVSFDIDHYPTAQEEDQVRQLFFTAGLA